MNKYNKNKIKSFIAAGRTGRALGLLMQYRSPDKDICNAITSISARYNTYLREKHGNLVDNQTLAIELNKINNSILHLIEDEIELNMVFFNDYTKAGLIISVIFFGIIIGSLQFNGFKNSEKNKSEKKDTMEIEFQPIQELFDTSDLLLHEKKVKINFIYEKNNALINKSPLTGSNQFLKVIHVNNEIKNGFPVYYFTLKNYMSGSVVINKFSITIHSHVPKKNFGGPKELQPLAIWDVRLPRKQGEFPYSPSKPIEIPSNNSCVIGIRFACKFSESETIKYLPPQKVAEFELFVNFFDDLGNKAESELFKIQ